MRQRFTQIIILTLIIVISLPSVTLSAQHAEPETIAKKYIQENYQKWNLIEEDIKELKITDQYATKHNKLTHIYFIQRYKGIEIYKALTGFNISEEGNVYVVNHRFIDRIASKVNTSQALISANDALHIVLEELKINTDQPFRLIQQEENTFLFDKTEIARQNVKVKLCYLKKENGTLQLSWNIILDEKNKINKWNFHIDATRGSILKQEDMVYRCRFEGHEFHRHDQCQMKDHLQANRKQDINNSSEKNLATNSYRVFEIPTESPAHGDHVIVTDPADPVASPHGWHDIDNAPGAEFTITRGNNVHAYQDRDGNLQSENDEPDGTSSLDFDFTFDEEQEPETYTDAATVNLFYMANVMHDFAYHYGFDEAAGNYQQNNYGNGGVQGDPVNALAQTGADANTFNNAFFSPSPDGLDGTLQMLLWDRNGGGNALLQVNAPATIAGAYDTGIPVNTSNNIPWFWGEEITLSNTISAEVVEANDGVYNPYITDACEDFIPELDLNGKIALIDRGGCDFSTKVLNAQNEGAVAVIICNYLEEIINMQPGADGNEVNIPAVFIKAGNCASIRQHIGNGLDITLTPPPPNGPDHLDGDFDNGIIAHEYAHGISSRLTGGPNSLGCFSFGEHDKAEGWSDFFGLAVTVRPGDTEETLRGYGTYVRREDNEGKGYRTYPYSTDMNVNPQTYANININTQVHFRGEIWTATLWDMYWALVEEYGWDEDLYTGTGGNNTAIQLVMDGLKLQPCDPNFIESRDAILMADSINNDFANACLLWEVFARRGLGVNASVGIPSFEGLDVCDKSLKISKTATPLVDAGDEILFFIRVTNHTDQTMTNVVATDQLPPGLTYVEGTCTIANFTAEPDMMTFELGNITPGNNILFTYRAKTSEDNKSISQFFDPAEVNSNWYVINDGNASNNWQLSTNAPYTGSKSWFVEDVFVTSQQFIELEAPITISGNQPVLRFYHKYITETTQDGGAVEVLPEGSNEWINVGDRIFRNPYDGFISYQTFVTPNFPAFWGFSNSYEASYVDLSDWQGQNILIRFRFGTNDSGAPSNGGWYVDDIELLDMYNYNGEACVSSDEGNTACATAPEGGTVIDTEVIVSTSEINTTDLTAQLFPNPANDQLNILLSNSGATLADISLLTLEGKVIQTERFNLNTEVQILTINLAKVPAGFYLVRIQSEKNSIVKKIVIQ